MVLLDARQKAGDDHFTTFSWIDFGIVTGWVVWSRDKAGL